MGRAGAGAGMHGEHEARCAPALGCILLRSGTGCGGRQLPFSQCAAVFAFDPSHPWHTPSLARSAAQQQQPHTGAFDVCMWLRMCMYVCVKGGAEKVAGSFRTAQHTRIGGMLTGLHPCRCSSLAIAPLLVRKR